MKGTLFLPDLGIELLVNSINTIENITQVRYFRPSSLIVLTVPNY